MKNEKTEDPTTGEKILQFWATHIKTINNVSRMKPGQRIKKPSTRA